MMAGSGFTFTDAENHDVPVAVGIAVAPGEAGADARVSVTLSPTTPAPSSAPSPSTGMPRWSCTPAAAREVAAALVRAAEEAENASADGPVTVRADELRRGDVRDGERPMTVDGARTDGSTAHITWKSVEGRTWTQSYDVNTAITLRRRLPGTR
ncbi:MULTISPECIES: hypothetical protein [Streptomyces]|uniref:hypothetical protein n=1 Tax=Streptomyces TaxID=1883 RepID=UPI0010405335|nr:MULTISPECIES: hypothetical protein [Streptomyces]MBT3077883.1 hypothetical protein [Streptomyces sp. COG21]MBT3084726.1 hypothetical protein [Streptomyces sp. COG20]MBT3085550.1 hypothetical protein [Streptomyces sp. CYG21]MBT3100169.1 hypothetical protein [Streptomyces sp. CBG30]MBT3103325.1 hypothetical protein [Streptomyces sp. COG19]